MKPFVAFALAASLSLAHLTATAVEPKSEKPVAAVPADVAVKAALEARLGNGAHVDEVRPAPIAGLWEARLGEDIVYLDAQANYFVFGNLIDARTRQNLTQARLDDINRVDLKSLPFDLAFKTVRGKGERVIVEFADPNCGFCKRFRQSIASMDNVTIYTFLYPILSPDSEVKAREVWCANDRAKTWDDWMTKGTALPTKADCANPVQKVVELGQKLKVNGTPTLFFADGRRVAGAIPPDRVEAHFAEAASARK